MQASGIYESWTELKRFVYSKVRDKALAEDIAQDVFLKVTQHLDQLKDSEKLKGWMFKIARNAVYDHFRSTVKQSHIPTTIDKDDPIGYNECVATCLQQMLATLPAKYREALVLAELENVPQTELTSRLQISYSGVKSRVQRARQMLRHKMESRYRIETDAYGNVIVCEDRVQCSCE
jgi:RNA polymerase sigma-70 factor (ECF subfamily)